MGTSNTCFHACLIFSMIILFCGCSLISSTKLSPSKRVELWNDLLPKTLLALYCYSSGDGQYGPEFVTFGKKFGWNFVVDAKNTTSSLYVCNLEWDEPGTNRVFSAEIAAYKPGNEELHQCNQCIWYARKDGLYHNPPLDKSGDDKLIEKWTEHIEG
ncbi:hypothetical protein AQUCO_03300120v1 [Aquilegia coerulea]|uniref:S-protein homolog n=1 Tax=Aquilegia coerulea TaxID=218851 RepID=A0A2G5CZJ6_AQUCA|nr:hypothetical protein AQUCO_03300120v1 [Aquilegia coerulea]